MKHKNINFHQLFFYSIVAAATFLTAGFGRSDKKGLLAYWSFDEGKGSQIQDLQTRRVDSIHYIFNKARFKPNSDPLWRSNGISGGALLFDGYSTWMERPAADFQVPSKALTISVWVAPRAFEEGAEGKLSAIVNQHNKVKKEGFILGMYRHGRLSFQVGTGSSWLELWEESNLLQKNAWTHVVATFDARSGKAVLYVNGKPAVQKTIPRHPPRSLDE
jgi:hypothetical protein